MTIKNIKTTYMIYLAEGLDTGCSLKIVFFPRILESLQTLSSAQIFVCGATVYLNSYRGRICRDLILFLNFLFVVFFISM